MFSFETHDDDVDKSSGPRHTARVMRASRLLHADVDWSLLSESSDTEPPQTTACAQIPLYVCTYSLTLTTDRD